MSSAYKLSFSILRHLHIAFYLLRRAGITVYVMYQRTETFLLLIHCSEVTL